MAGNVKEIVDRSTGSSARVLLSLGFNCFSWRPVLADGPREILWADAGFDAGNKRPSGSGIPLLFPFPGRIGRAAFQFAGREYCLEPGDAFGNAIHGFVYNRPWRIVEHNGARLVGEFQASVDDASILDRWPADFRIRVAYEVRGRQLVSQIEYANTGDEPLPCGFGTHAYFRLPLTSGGHVADTVVTVPVTHLWEVEQMIPTGRLLPIALDQQLAEGLRLDDHQFDTCFTGIRADSDNLVRTRLTDPRTGRRITQTFSSTFMQCIIYTPGHRQAICVEPYTCVPDAIRLAAEGHETGLQILQPGEKFATTINIKVEEEN
jgi:aldose 1-epimerase